MIKWPWVYDFLPLLCRASLRMKMERNTSTRSQSSLRCLRFPRGSWSSTLTSLVRRTSKSFRTLARWDHTFVCLYMIVTINGRPRQLCNRYWRFLVQISVTAFRKFMFKIQLHTTTHQLNVLICDKLPYVHVFLCLIFPCIISSSIFPCMIRHVNTLKLL